MPLTLLIESELDERSATAAANRAERVYAEASRNIGKQMSSEIGRGAQEAGKAVDQMVDTAQASYRKMLNAQDELAAAERQLKQMREDGARGVEIQAERVRQARRREREAIREAAAAMDDYERSAQRAGEAGEGAGNSVIASLRGAAGRASSAGQELAGGFAEGFAGAAALMRIGAAGGPIGIALAGVAALGVTAGKILADNINQGLASLAMQDAFQARLGADDASMRRYAKAAADAYTDQWGASVEDNLSAVQFGIQGGLISRGATDQEVKTTAEQMQALAQTMNADVQEVARAGGQLIRAGIADNAEQAMDILAAGSQKGLNIAGDWLDTSTEYATQWRKLGLSGSDAIGLINQGLEGAARDSDVVADSLKEFSIRAVDGSKTTAEGFAALGFDADDMSRRFAIGGDTARDAFGAVLKAIKETDDPMQQKLIWASLFGTQFEDMGDAINRFDLSKAKTEVGSTDGTVKTLTDTLSKNASGWDGLGRNIDLTFDKLKRWLADTDIGRFIGQGIPQGINDRLNQLTAGDIPLPFTNPSGDGLTPGAPGVAPMPGVAPGPAVIAPGSSGGNPLDIFAPVRPSGAPVPGDPSAAPAPGNRKPLVPDSAGGGGSSKPSFDPSQYSVDAIPVQGNIPLSPLAPGAPGARLVVDPGKVFDAETSQMSARTSVESARVRVLELEASGTATAQDIQAAKNQVQTAERAYLSAEAKLQEAQRGSWQKMENTAKAFSDGMNNISAGLDADLGISKGLGGIADNLVRFLGSLALAGPMAQMNALSQANPNQGSGLMGMLASNGVFGQQYTPQAIAASSGSGGYSPSALGPVALQPGAAYPGDAALLANVPKGIGQYDNTTKDLSRGLVDCASGVEDLVNILDGKSTTGGSLWTGNAASVLPQMGFLPGMGGPGDFRIGYRNGGPGGGHMQATLPGGTNVNFGSTEAIQAGGQDGSLGAYDPSFTSHYYRPMGTPASTSVAPAPSGPSWINGSPAATPGNYSPPPQDQLTNPGLSSPSWQGPGLNPRDYSGGGGQSPVFNNASGPGIGGTAGQSDPFGVAPTAGPGGGGIGITPGGTVDTAIGIAAAAGNMFAPGAGAAAQAGMKLASRAIQYGGTVAGIAADGLLQTFLPQGSEKAGAGWLQRGVGALASVKPALPNLAGGKGSPKVNPQDQQSQQPGQPPVQGGDTNITVNNQRATEDGTGKDIAFHLGAQNSGPGW